MAKCTFTAAAEAEMLKRFRRIQWYMTLDTFNEEQALQGIEAAKVAIMEMAKATPNLDLPTTLKEYEKSKEIAVRRFKRMSRLKFKMGDYVERIHTALDECSEIAERIYEHHCGSNDHPENVR